MNYTAAIPALNALANADANAFAPVHAQAIAVGDPHNFNDVQAATDEVESRKRLREVDENRVTNAEMGAARVRRHAVVGEIAAGMYPGAGAPAWFAPAIQAALQPIESRGIARIFNTLVSDDEHVIEPLVNNNGVIPVQLQQQPLTLGMLKALPIAAVDALLAAYGQVVAGNVGARRRRLAVWFGLRKAFF